jgi:hypothetical protein
LIDVVVNGRNRERFVITTDDGDSLDAIGHKAVNPDIAWGDSVYAEVGTDESSRRGLIVRGTAATRAFVVEANSPVSRNDEQPVPGGVL